MKTLFLATTALSLLLFIPSCIKHEVVPPPTSTVNLDCNFTGYVNGTQVEFTQNVQGYQGYNSFDTYIAPSPQPSRRVYMSEMVTPIQPLSMRIKFGALNWDVAANSEPSLTMFGDFFVNAAANVQTYSNSAVLGFEVAYTDNNSVIWLSKENNPMPQTVSFSNVKQVSDATGDYATFNCNFSCYVYRTNPQTSLIDSLYIQNGKYNGWFRR